MNDVEQRVRVALLEDGRRIGPPPAPPVSDLVRSRRRDRLVVGGLTAAAVVVVVLIVADWSGPSGLEVGPADEPDPVRSAPTVSYDGEDVFASGTTAGEVGWTGAANVTDGLPCVGIRINGPDVAQEVVGCETVRTAIDVRLAAVIRPGDHGVVGVAGWVSDDVARLVWVLPDGPVEFDLHTRPGLPARLFAGGAHVGTRTTGIEAYDAAGHRLATVKVVGAGGPGPADGETE